TLLASAGEGWDSALDAKAAVKSLLDRIRSGSGLEDWVLGDRHGFGVSTEHGPLAEHPVDYPSAAERDRVSNDAATYFEDYFERCAGNLHGFHREDDLFVHCKSAPPCCTENSDSNDDPPPAGLDSVLSAYRLSAAQPVATHPKNLASAAERDDLVADIRRARERGELAYSDFSVTAIVATSKTEGAGAQEKNKSDKPAKKAIPEYHYQWRAAGLHTFQSVRSFPNEQQAIAAFEKDLYWLLAAARRSKSYRELEIKDRGMRLALVKEEGDAVVYLPKVAPGEAGEARKNWQRYAEHYPFRHKSGNGWTIHLVDPDGKTEWLRGTESFPDRLIARRAYIELLDLLTFLPNYRSDDRPEAGIYRLEITETLLEAAITYADEEPAVTERTPCPLICPADYPKDRYPIGDQDWPVLSECPPTPPIDASCPKAWDEGLETFLLHGTDPDNYYDFLDPGAGCRHGFRVVTPGYEVARNPRESHTPLEREKLLSWLYQYNNCRLEKDARPYEQCVTFGAGTYRPALRPPGGTIHWLATNRFATREDAENYWSEEMVRLLGYAREPDYYQARKTEPDADGNMRYRLHLVDDNGEVVLESQEDFLRESIANAARERISLARNFPIYLFRDKYGFLCYSEGELPDFREGHTSDCLPAEILPAPRRPQGEQPPQTELYGGVLELNLTVPGEVIWESSEEFTTAGEAWEAYRCFRRLLGDPRNYQRIQLTDCNLFGLELTRPDYVLAEHPRRYPGPRTLAKAKEETLSRVNGEGMRLVEHILLRPRALNDATIPYVCPEPAGEAEEATPSCPNRDRWLPPTVSEKPTVGKAGQPVKQLETDPEPYVPGADPYSYWATIVLPYWPQRFQNINFRSFFEDTLRREAPAHVALKICWLDPKQMRVFGLRYREWVRSLDWDEACGRAQAQDRLIDFLANMTSVYPPARLQADDCESAGVTDAGAVLLDNTQLS
ncbi:MAG: hypothetical protein WA952_13305, partial [Lewinella sp.]